MPYRAGLHRDWNVRASRPIGRSPGGASIRAPDQARSGPGLSASLLRVSENHDPDLGHVLDSVADTLPPEARILHATVGHVVGPVGRHVVDDDAAHDELFEALPGVLEVIGEDAGLEAVEALV